MSNMQRCNFVIQTRRNAQGLLRGSGGKWGNRVGGRAKIAITNGCEALGCCASTDQEISTLGYFRTLTWRIVT